MSKSSLALSHLAGKPSSTVEFARLLESGDIHSAIAYRLEYLTHKIRQAREECEPPKVALLGVTAIAGIAGATFTSPVLLGLAAFGGVAYAASLSLQALQGGEIKPLPFSSQSLWATLGKISDRSATGYSPLGELPSEIANPSGYLDPIERAEYQILAGNLRFAECVFSSAQHPASRWGLWQLVARKFADGTINEYFGLNEIEDAKDLAPRLRSAEALLGNPGRYSVTALGMEVETWELTPVAPVEQKRIRSKEPKAIPPAPLEPSPWDAPVEESLEPAKPTPVVATLERAYAAAVQEEAQIDEFQHLATTALEYLQANPFISRSWYGGQRTGKSYGAAQVSKWMHDNLGTKIYYINLFSYAPDNGQREDDAYWGHAERKYYADWRRLPSGDAAEIALAKAMAVFEAFNQGNENALLIVDEWASTGAKAARYQPLLERLTSEVSSLCTNLDSSGVKQRQAVWLISPKMVAGALTDSGKILKHLPLVYAAITEGQGVDWQGNSIRFDGELHDQICNNYTKFPAPKYDADHPRKIYLGGTWYPPGW